jgi:membrane associated rhomboid family serine protease
LFPLDDSVDIKSWPIFLFGIVVANFFVFIYETSLSNSAIEQLFQTFGLVPATAFSTIPHFFVAASTSMFLHLGWGHLLGNMWFLWIFGRAVEDRLGHLEFIVLYCLSGWFAAVVQLLINPGETSPMVGASGAISGVLGAYCYAFPRSRIKTLMLIWFWLRLVEIPAAVYLGFWFFMQVVTGFSTILSGDQTPVQVAFFAHVGGFVCGLMIAYLTLDREAY